MIKRSCILSAVMVLLCGLALGSCRQDVVSVANYTCDDGRLLNTVFTNGEIVKITFKQEIITIPRVKSASGARYESADSGAIFWSKGVDAMFTENENALPVKCKRQ